MRTSIATVSLGGTLEEKIDAVAAAGFDGLELLDADVAAARSSRRDIASRCADSGLTIDLYQPFRRAEGVSAAEFADVVTRFRGELDVMSELGATSILVVSNTDDDADGSREHSAEQIATLCDIAAEHAMVIQFEALAWGTHVSRVADAFDVVQRADRTNLFLVVDTFHLLAGNETVSVLEELPSGVVGFVQVADAPVLSMDLKTWSRNHRCFPGGGELELHAPVSCLLAAGYTGPISLEIFNPGYRERPAHEVARAGADALAVFLDDLAHRTSLSAAGS